jgi:hypothetical protein
MNLRIELLAEQCGFRSNPDIYDRNQSFDIPKFAELIVRECADWIKNTESDPDIGEEDANALLQHFGVK